MPTSGDSFERLVAQIQARVDPAANVAHNQFLVDRLRQRRQFDVVIRGQFAGQTMLGVIECKDLKRRVGTPQVDAFHTKAQDINANFKVIASRRGFTRPALEKAAHYGIRAISLLDPEALNHSFAIGDWWTAKVFRWNRIHVRAHPADATQPEPDVPPEQFVVSGGRVLDWFTNYLLREGHADKALGGAINLQLTFDPPIRVSPAPDRTLLCKAMSFHAERECREYERYVPLSAEAFVDWHSMSATIPASTQVLMPAVPADFREGTPRDPTKKRDSYFLPVFIVAHEHQFEQIPDAPDLEAM